MLGFPFLFGVSATNQDHAVFRTAHESSKAIKQYLGDRAGKK